MQDKSNPKEKEGLKEQAKALSDMADQALKNYEQALRTGLKLQEEAVRCWTSLVNQTAAQDWQKGFVNFSKLTNNALPAAQKRMEEVLELVEKNSRSGTELMRKALEAAQPQAIGDGQKKWTDLWTSSLGAMRSNAEALGQINAKAIDSWIEFVRKSAQASEGRFAKAA